MKAFAYIDGESHFNRAAEFFQARDAMTLEQVAARFNHVTLNRRGRLFWAGRSPGQSWDRTTYFTSTVGSDADLHDLQLQIRKSVMEPDVVKEAADLAEQRKNKLAHTGYLYKPKGVDIALAVRMIEDAALDNFDHGILFTSDADYLPLIRAVRRMGKLVGVYGFRNGLGERSPLLHVPDYFQDLGDLWKQELPAPE